MHKKLVLFCSLFLTITPCFADEGQLFCQVTGYSDFSFDGNNTMPPVNGLVLIYNNSETGNTIKIGGFDSTLKNYLTFPISNDQSDHQIVFGDAVHGGVLYIRKLTYHLHSAGGDLISLRADCT